MCCPYIRFRRTSLCTWPSFCLIILPLNHQAPTTYNFPYVDTLYNVGLLSSLVYNFYLYSILHILQRIVTLSIYGFIFYYLFIHPDVDIVLIFTWFSMKIICIFCGLKVSFILLLSIINPAVWGLPLYVIDMYLDP